MVHSSSNSSYTLVIRMEPRNPYVAWEHIVDGFTEGCLGCIQRMHQATDRETTLINRRLSL